MIEKLKKYFAEHTKFATYCIKCKFKNNGCDEEHCWYDIAVKVLHENKEVLENEGIRDL